ncbi:PREDICTED: importin-5-like [Ipomoea nil]|uniref:importin-5-like n=1 Tax=Ipomoea nil TaxID=35883 RepID=UPI000900EB3D|nr:PREDICTED: importin-5-like [Ipomoea nil]
MESPSTSEQNPIHSQIKELLNEHNRDGFFDFVNYLFSEDEALRNPADSLYNIVMNEYPNALSNKLALAINSSPDTQTRFRCSTLFSRNLAAKSPLIHHILNKRFKTFFIQLLQDEEEWEILKIHCACVSSIAALLLPKQDWPELVVLMFEWLSSPNSTLTRWASVVLLYELIPKCPDTFSPYVETISLEFKRLLDQDDNRARIATVGAAAKFILHLATPSNHNQYYGLLTRMITVLGDDVYDQDLACNALDAMAISAKAKPSFFALHIKYLAEAMLVIASDTNLNEKMRILAVNFFITVAEGGDESNAMIQNLPSNLIEDLLTQLLQMLMCVEDDISWSEADVYDMNAGKTAMSCCAEDALSRLAIVLGGDVVVPNSPDSLPDFFEDDDWKKRYAAAGALGLIASGCSKMLVQYLEESLEKTMALVSDQHPRVRWAAIYAISEFSKYLSPFFQEQCHQQVIPALSEVMDDFSNPRVQTYAARAMSKFCQNCCSNILKPYLKEMISKLLMFLQAGKTFLKETALTELASLADSTKDDFRPFYPMVMPYLKLILITETSNCMLVAKTLECITLVAVAVGKSVFSTDVEEIVNVLLSEHNRVDMDDQVKCYLLQAWGRICVSLGEDFRPYLSASVPLLIESAKLEDHLKNNFGNFKQRSIILKEMLWACNTIRCFAIHIKGGLHLWIKKVLNGVLPLVNFKFDEEVRVAAISVMPLLLRSAATAVENELPIPGFLDSPIITLAKIIIPTLVEALAAPTIKTQAQALVALKESMQIASTWEPDKKEILDSILMVLSACFNRKKERENMAKYSLDFRKPELVKEEIQEEQNVCREVRICVQILLKKPDAEKLFSTILYVKHMWKKDSTPEERKMALSIFSDIAVYCREQGLRLYTKFIPSLLGACNDTNPDIQQIAICAIAIYAEFGREAFKLHLQDGLASLEAIFQPPGESSLERSMTKEAAVSAYGKLCFFLCEEIKSYQNIDLWLFHLPLKCNFGEAKTAHRLLCSMVDKPETMVTGPNDEYVRRIITIMAEVLWAGEHIAEEETKSKMIQQLKMFRLKLGDKFVAICKALPPALQNTLRTYL